MILKMMLKNHKDKLNLFFSDTDPSTLLRDPGLLRIGELVEPSVNGPFDIALRQAQGSWAKALLLRCRYLS